MWVRFDPNPCIPDRTWSGRTLGRMKVKVWRSNKDGLWYISTLGDNNEVVYPSEGHRNKGDAEAVARKFAPAGAEVEVVD